MRRLLAILLFLVFLPLGTGALEYLHNLQHAAEDAAEAVELKKAGKPEKSAPVHDESNCFVHAQLHLLTISTGWVPLLVFLGILVAFLTEIAQPLFSQPQSLTVACRGPPVCA